MCPDYSGSLGRQEFGQYPCVVRVIAPHALKLDASDARTLSTLLEQDCSGSVEIDEFLEGYQRLMRESRHLDNAVMRYEMPWLRHSLETLAGPPRRPSKGLRASVRRFSQLPHLRC